MTLNTKKTDNNQLAKTKCAHCGLDVNYKNESICRDNKHFCCKACSYVYQIINDLGLTNFYNIKDSLDIDNKKSAHVEDINYGHFSGKEFERLYVKYSSANQAEITFFLKDIHCAACIWLIEKIEDLIPGVISANVNFSDNTVNIKFKPSIVTISKIASTLNSLGYPPQAIMPDEIENAQNKANKKLVSQIAVAGVCAGNTMLIAVSLYQGFFSGIEEKYLNFFQWFSFAITLPCLIYSANPFYKAALGGLKARILHIDLPISFGIVIGFLASFWNTVNQNDKVYYDSICMLVFLLLVSRWLQKKGTSFALNSNELLYGIIPSLSRRIDKNNIVETFSGELKKGELCLVKESEIFPVDGIIKKGETNVDLSILTGESLPKKLKVNENVYAGSLNLSSPVEVEATETASESRIAKLILDAKHRSKNKAKFIQLTDKVSSYFVLIVFSVALASAIYFYLKFGFQESLDRTLSLLIISCPCAIGLSAPLSFAVALKNAQKKGIFIRSEETFEKLLKIKKIYFDKTGTLTLSKQEVNSIYLLKDSNFIKMEFNKNLTEENSKLLSNILSLESEVKHPIAFAIKDFLKDKGIKVEKIEELQYEPSLGVFQKDHKKIKRVGSLNWHQKLNIKNITEVEEITKKLTEKNLTPSIYSEDQLAKLIIGTGNLIKAGTQDVIRFFKENNIETNIISGDIEETTRNVAREIGVKSENTFFLMTPERKVSKIRDSQLQFETAMVGDGANDAAAMKEASISIAVKGGAEASLKLADVFISSDSIYLIEELFKSAKKATDVVKRNLLFSLFYNIMGATAAIYGLINPLVAAIFMPLSSLTVVISSLSSSVKSQKLESIDIEHLQE